ncbi:hypothetical protein ASE82_14680 [Sphingomonas sp. Leaf230]|uniref:hypothetical protein n=1 Tax=Sphingomonas sp. Leaf230 TaxID=1735694 RepID=UPI0006FD9B20|nr:hypothetical protein [Sphingomonas sp. Leaf230]KQN01680.1 hypothetical protein ASE82_14680 [Sphingomonas sp. Leaf230]
MTNDDDVFLRAHTVAVTRLLLGNRKMHNGVVVTGCEHLDFEGRTRMARMATLSNPDIVGLEFGVTDVGSYGLTGITIYMPCDNGCFVQTNCQLWLSKAGNRVVILPRPESRGHFRLSPRELIHIDGKPAAAPGDGIHRAVTWLKQRTGSRVTEFANCSIVEDIWPDRIKAAGGI